MRLQFNAGVTFDDAAALVGYMHRLGISHVYASPILAARAGSTHGYDVIDPTRISDEIGGRAGLERLVAAPGRAVGNGRGMEPDGEGLAADEHAIAGGALAGGIGRPYGAASGRRADALSDADRRLAGRARRHPRRPQHGRRRDPAPGGGLVAEGAARRQAPFQLGGTGYRLRGRLPRLPAGDHGQRQQLSRGAGPAGAADHAGRHGQYARPDRAAADLPRHSRHLSRI